MSSTSKTIVWVVVAVVLIGGIWWYVSMQGGSGTATTSPAAQSATGNPAAGISQGSSDADLAQDLGQVDAQMNGLSSDSASINQALAATSSVQ